ncbi:MAG: hypothetical protein GTO53_05920 [Planctomycetales bacterium]|nr:hypothetical protein [Planctomycetales bacterium]NIM08681.1 hypothetical protein [Planctomycetales bacterium]NIN08155.1 hypothetical protein [Planctomycetales bacterium]NIN77282.1 hypothetical protein [Planctomycetales bacterium]NIO34466.1 hypothetical protein [Planctomycetales bacterium]
MIFLRPCLAWRRICLHSAALAALSGSFLNPANAQPWIDIRAFGPFVCRADFLLSGHERIFADLARIQEDLVHHLQIPPAQERIEIYLFRSRAQYDQYLNRWFPNVPYRRALYVKNKGPGMVLAYFSDSLDTDMRHECTHALLHASLPMVPLWLDEGLAEYFENPPDERATGSPHRKGLRWSLRLGQLPSLERLEAKRQLSEMGRVEYRAAWAWTHFLLHGPPAAQQELVRYLADVRQRTPPGQFSDRLQQRLPDPSGQLVRHIKQHFP